MQRNSTIGELMERKRIQDGAKEYQGHTYMDLARFDDATKHMIIFDVLTDESPVGWKGELCFGAAALIGVPIFFLVKATGNVSLAALSMMIVMLPLFFLAMYEKDSQPLEVVVEHFIQTKFVRPKVRPYQTDNYYDALMRQYKLEKEVERIVFQKEATGKKHQNACKSESEAAARN